jgi:HlyD family secretion protein
VVQPGQVLMTLSPAGDTELVVQIDEKNLSLLQLGQKAIGSADAYPGQTFAAELGYINPSVDATRGSVQVKLKVPDPPAYLRQDMTVSVEIEVARRPRALAVSTDAIRDVTSLHPWVLKVNSSRAKRQPVRIGVRGDNTIEIIDGLAAGDLVIPATNKTVSEGQRVRAAAR